MPRTILVQSPVVERTNQSHSHGRISQTVDRWLMRLFFSNFNFVFPQRDNKGYDCKNVLSLFLCAVMIISCSCTVFAANTSPKN